MRAYITGCIDLRQVKRFIEAILPGYLSVIIQLYIKYLDEF